MAYGSVRYLHLVNDKGQVQCNLLYARSRVAPLKSMTIPKLELAAAVLSVQQDQMLHKELSIPIADSIFWSDSMVVLAYIHNERKRFHTYVANRLAVIHKGSLPQQWRHVRSEDNPADDISRGLCMQDLMHNNRWLHRPEFLSRQRIESQVEPSEVNLEGDPEVKRDVTVTTTEVKRDTVKDLIDKYSSWSKLKHGLAWLLRYRKYLLAKARGQEPACTDKRLSVQELKDTETSVIRYVQSQEYGDKMRSLQGTTGNIKESSRIYKLNLD